MRIIPAIDIIDGACVRLKQGDYHSKTVYYSNPIDVAKQFEDSGIIYLHVVDLDGAKARKIVNWKSIVAICNSTNLKVDFGGGISSEEDIQKLLDVGVQQVNLGSIAIKEPVKVSSWIQFFGADKIILSADVRGEVVATHGWTENSSITISDLINSYDQLEIQYITCTDISKDGMLSGPNFKLYQKLITEFPTKHFIASGGVRSLGDIDELKSMGVYGVIVGKAIYEGNLSLEELATRIN